MIQRKLTFLADENVEYRIIKHLRKIGYDVLASMESLVSMKDETILKKAYQEDRILITNDKDFGDLIFLQKLEHKGIILFRFKSEIISDKLNALDVLLENYQDKIKSKFVVLEETRIKIR